MVVIRVRKKKKPVGNWTFELGLTQTHNGGHYWLIPPEAIVAYLFSIDFIIPIMFTRIQTSLITP